MRLTEKEIDKLEDLIIRKEIEIQQHLDLVAKFGKTTKETLSFCESELDFWSGIYQKLQTEKQHTGELN